MFLDGPTTQWSNGSKMPQQQQPQQQDERITSHMLLDHASADKCPENNCTENICTENNCTTNGDNKKAHLHYQRRTPTQSELDLLHWKDMPRHLQFNPYIFTGYRPLLTFWGCINSLFYMHNETINILTHAIPIIYILVTVPPLMPWSQLWFLSWCHVLGIVCPWVGSSIYHLFMNLERGERTYYRLLQIDMLGIWINQSFGAMPMVTATTYCLPTVVRWFFLGSYTILSGWGFYKAMTAWSPWERRLCFLLPFTLRVLLCFLRFTSLGGGDPGAFTHIILQDMVSVLGAAIGAMHIPEKWFPGCVDIYLNSHNIMHVLVVAAVYSMHVSTVRDLNWMTRAKCAL